MPDQFFSFSPAGFNTQMVSFVPHAFLIKCHMHAHTSFIPPIRNHIMLTGCHVDSYYVIQTCHHVDSYDVIQTFHHVDSYDVIQTCHHVDSYDVVGSSSYSCCQSAEYLHTWICGIHGLTLVHQFRQSLPSVMSFLLESWLTFLLLIPLVLWSKQNVSSLIYLYKSKLSYPFSKRENGLFITMPSQITSFQNFMQTDLTSCIFLWTCCQQQPVSSCQDCFLLVLLSHANSTFFYITVQNYSDMNFVLCMKLLFFNWAQCVSSRPPLILLTNSVPIFLRNFLLECLTSFF